MNPTSFLRLAVAVALGAAVARALQQWRARARPASAEVIDVPWSREN